MFGAIGRWFKSLGFFMSGRVDNSRRQLDRDPQAIRAKYDEVVREKTAQFTQYKQAVAGLMAQQESKMDTLKQVSAEVERLETLKAGALAKAQQRVGELKASGAGKDAIQSDEDYQKCLSAYNDFSSTLDEKQARINELENDVTEYGTRIDEHRISIKELAQDIEKIRSEAHDAVAEVISAQQEKELAEALGGLPSGNKTGEKLSELRRTRQEIRAEANLAKDLSGSDQKLREAEFLKYAQEHQQNSEFEALVGLADATDTSAAADTSATTDTNGTVLKSDKLPE